MKTCSGSGGLFFPLMLVFVWVGAFFRSYIELKGTKKKGKMYTGSAT